MKIIPKFTLAALAAAFIGNSAALADSTQLQEWLAVQRREMERRQQATTIAVYADRQAVTGSIRSGRSAAAERRSELRYETVTQAHGQSGQPVGAYVPVTRR